MEAINPVSSVKDLAPLIEAAQAQGRGEEVSREFLTIFYKEMLKQSLQAPALSFDPDKNEEGSFFTAFNSDIMVEQFARQLAQNQLSAARSQLGLPVERPAAEGNNE
ncbi:MAG: hypothetical protein JW873_05880 [Candidatus Saganbacteria bacterium]|nr:hypothetical protein [Candidatus Saganbacteria bacterium]